MDFEEIAKRELTSEKKYKMLNQSPSKNSSKSNFGGSSEKQFYSTPLKSSTPQMLSFNKSESRYYNSTHKVKTITTTTEDDKTLFNNIDEILNRFVKHFSNHSGDYILDCLKRNSFNLQDTYLQLCKPNEFEGI